MTDVKSRRRLVKLAIPEEMKSPWIAHAHCALPLFSVGDGMAPGVRNQEERGPGPALKLGLQGVILARSIGHAPVDGRKSRPDQSGCALNETGSEVTRDVHVFRGENLIGFVGDVSDLEGVLAKLLLH